MIRHILIIPVFFLAANILIAQPEGVKYNIGPKAGFNVYKSRFNFSEDEATYEQKYKIGFQLGIALDLPLKEMIHFNVEFYYSRKGKKTIIVDEGFTNDATYNFLEIPLLLRFSFNASQVRSGNLNWHLDIGPTMSYWLGGKGELSSTGPTIEYEIVFGDPPAGRSELDKMYISQANRLQWGLMAGAGIEYPIFRSQVLFVDLRAAFGGSNLAESEGSANLPILGFSDSMDVRFLEFSLSAAYTFEIDWIQTRRGKSTVRKRKKS